MKYKSILGPKETEHAIVAIKDFFQLTLSTELDLTRVTAPLFVPCGSGLNDDLNGVERPVSFEVGNMGGQKMEIVQSLAKWKRVKVTEMGLTPGFGIVAFDCPKCKTEMTVPEDLINQDPVVRCPECNFEFDVNDYYKL